MSSQTDWALIRAGDSAARNRVWEEYQPAVEYVARKLSSGLPRHVSVHDLKSAGQFGLLDAISKFDPARGYKFETYALTRIRGSILDDLRSQDWVPRSVRQKDRSIDSATQELTQYYNRTPTDAEIAGFLEVTVEEVSKARSNSSNNFIFNIDQPFDDDENLTLGDSLSENNGDLSDLITTMDSDVVLDAIKALPEREKITIAMHYSMGMTLAEIGRQFNVTESRVCQIHTKALKSIRETMVK
jgi:RNA polymerase sigma factor for flagellar operon FliA